ncbi:Zn [Pyrenophora teres f. teres]|nr:Zn [Pyrenophora teres f. teres]
MYTSGPCSLHIPSIPAAMRPLRPLLPSATRPRNEPLPLLPRERVASACDQCRVRKIKCNGKRPVCLECVRRSTPCHYAARSTETQGQALKRKYDALQSENEAYAELFNLIRTRPDDEAFEIIRRIKMGADARDILKHIKEADLLIQLNLRPQNRFRYTLPFKSTIPAHYSHSENLYYAPPSSESAPKPVNILSIDSLLDR